MKLAAYTTLRLGGPARRFVVATAEDEVVAETSTADRAGEPVLVLGGGSNLVVSDEGFPGTVVHIATRGVRFSRSGEQVIVTAQAGEDWEVVVAHCVSDGLAGIECLSGIPGLVGAVPMQNVGAYGQEVAQTLVEVRALDRRTGDIVTMDAEACRFSYRNSLFKGSERYVILTVTLALTESRLSGPISYPELARALEIPVGERVPLAEARQAVLGLRRGKGMVLDPRDPDTYSAGSFFTNPVLTARQTAELERLAPGFPRYPAEDAMTKVPAAWLIEQAGFTKGYTRGPVRISTKHTLALTNPGSGSTRELLELAREVRDGVREKFGIELVNEPVFVGVHW